MCVCVCVCVCVCDASVCATNKSPTKTLIYNDSQANATEGQGNGD